MDSTAIIKRSDLIRFPAAAQSLSLSLSRAPLTLAENAALPYFLSSVRRAFARRYEFAQRSLPTYSCTTCESAVILCPYHHQGTLLLRLVIPRRRRRTTGPRPEVRLLTSTSTTTAGCRRGLRLRISDTGPERTRYTTLHASNTDTHMIRQLNSHMCCRGNLVVVRQPYIHSAL